MMLHPTQELEPPANPARFNVMIRIMDKIKDGQRPDGTFVALTDRTSRARIEVSVKGKELAKLGLTDIASLRHLKLTELQGPYFQFRLPTFKKPQAVRHVSDLIQNTKEAWRAQTYLRSGVLGLVSMDQATQLRRKKMTPKLIRTVFSNTSTKVVTKAGRLSTNTFVAYEALNRKVALAFRDLAAREARVWKPCAVSG
jgi:hypothetical protein